MLVVDFMHEFELGVWKALFTHLVRILYAVAPHARQVAELDERFCYLVCTEFLTYLYSCRYRQIMSFGSTIRGWSSNASEMKKLAARDFEDLLQVYSFLSRP